MELQSIDLEITESHAFPSCQNTESYDLF